MDKFYGKILDIVRENKLYDPNQSCDPRGPEWIQVGQLMTDGPFPYGGTFCYWVRQSQARDILFKLGIYRFADGRPVDFTRVHDFNDLNFVLSRA